MLVVEESQVVERPAVSYSRCAWALNHMDSSMCPSAPDIGCGSSKAQTHGVLLLFEQGFETFLLLLRIDGAIQVRSNVDPTFDSLVGSGRSGGGPLRLLSSRESIHPNFKANSKSLRAFFFTEMKTYSASSG